jgi:hypothetical protein
MSDEVELGRALKELAEMAPGGAGAAVEEQLRRRFRQRRRGNRLRWLLVAAAACLALAAGWMAAHREPATPTAPTARANAFVPLPYGQSDVPLESGVIVRVRLQSDAGPVDADLLVGQDGMARAVRFDQ